jgi:hypothetical protein
MRLSGLAEARDLATELTGRRADATLVGAHTSGGAK